MCASSHHYSGTTGQSDIWLNNQVLLVCMLVEWFKALSGAPWAEWKEWHHNMSIKVQLQTQLVWWGPTVKRCCSHTRLQKWTISLSVKASDLYRSYIVLWAGKSALNMTGSVFLSCYNQVDQISQNSYGFVCSPKPCDILVTVNVLSWFPGLSCHTLCCVWASQSFLRLVASLDDFNPCSTRALLCNIRPKVQLREACFLLSFKLSHGRKQQ